MPSEDHGNPRWNSPLHLLRWLGRHERGTLILLLAAAAGIWGFFELADEVLEGETHHVDQALLLALRSPGNPADPIGPHWLEEMGRDFTALGGVGVQALITAAMAGSLWLAGKRRAALMVLLAIGGGITLSLLLKGAFDRPRPELVPHGSYTYTSSFPSGHSMTAAVTYLTLGALLMRLVPQKALKIYFFLLAVLLTLLVGLSRVYLGVHWPSDVLAGWTAGFIWALLCWTVMRKLQLEGKVEEEGEVTEDPEGEKPQPHSS
jgi:undecaprenyl-diphosphatase